MVTQRVHQASLHLEEESKQPGLEVGIVDALGGNGEVTQNINIVNNF